jgi:hypothetical protein
MRPYPWQEMTMTKELYLQAIEALRQRVEAAGEEEIEVIEEEFPVSDFVELFDGSIDDYIGFKIDNENEVEPDEALDIILEEAETWLLAAVFKLAWLKHNRDQVKQEILEALANPADWVAQAERPAEAADSRPDMPDGAFLDQIMVGSEGDDWEDDDPEKPLADAEYPDIGDAWLDEDEWDEMVDGDEDFEDDDPDWAGEYGDGDEDEDLFAFNEDEVTPGIVCEDADYRRALDGDNSLPGRDD